MKKYFEPEVTVTKFQAEAVLLVSGTYSGDGGFDEITGEDLSDWQ